MFAYLFPPFCLIARCLKKLESDRALALMVVLLWPTQAWWLVKPSHSNSCYSTSAQGLTDTSSQRDGTPSKDQAKDGGMSVIREFYETQGVPQSATNLLLASWRGGTKNQYDVYIIKWTKFCAERQADQFLPLVVDVLDFLTELYENGYLQCH